jgi:hypothetical protein
MLPRAGLKIGDVSGPQKKAAMGLLANFLEHRLETGSIQGPSSAAPAMLKREQPYL